MAYRMVTEHKPSHRRLDIRDGHTSMGTIPNKGRREQNKARDTRSGYNVGGKIVRTGCHILAPLGDTGVRNGVGNTIHARKNAWHALRVGLVQTEPRRRSSSVTDIPHILPCISWDSSPSVCHTTRYNRHRLGPDDKRPVSNVRSRGVSFRQSFDT
jgi:hypothetical protein